MTINDIDKIFFICLSNVKERINNVKEIINNLNTNYFINDKIKINYTNQINLYDDINIVNNLSKYLPYDNENKNYNTHIINSFSCFLNHYNIISEAYFLNYNYILIFEDDAYINNFKEFKELVNNIPNDMDMIQFQSYEHIQKQCIFDNNFKNDYFYKVINLCTCSNACIILSKKIINYIYNNYWDNKVIYADAYQYTSPFFLNECNIYMPKKQIIDIYKFESKITY